MTDHRPSPAGSDTDSWDRLRATTTSRIGLGRTGCGLPTSRLLDFNAAHSAARDAVHLELDVDRLADDISELGIGVPVSVRSRASNRSEYLRRPDLGRTLRSSAHVVSENKDIGFVLADGLSPRALGQHGTGLLEALVSELSDRHTIAAPVIATQARVALGDHIAAASGVRTVIVIIGERPGLSVVDSLGIYLTHLPYPGRTDADRNCVSNIHPPDGQSYLRAAQITRSLLTGALALGRSGVDLKDNFTSELTGSETYTIEHTTASHPSRVQ